MNSLNTSFLGQRQSTSSSAPIPAHPPTVVLSNPTDETAGISSTRPCEGDSYALSKSDPERRFQLNPWIQRKYGAKQLLSFHFAGRETLSELRDKYKSVRCEPSFLRHFLQLQPSIHRQLLWARSELYDWNDSGDWVTMPNPRYPDTAEIVMDPTTVKESPVGFGLVGWFVHPDRLSKTAFADPEVRAGGHALTSVIKRSAEPGEDLEYGLARPHSGIQSGANDNTTVAEITDDPDSFLATILDLDASHIAWLEEIKERTLEHLRSVYDVDPERDRVQLYFHFPYVEKTATLHLHVRVNQGIHPTEQLKAFQLDEILDALRTGHSVADVVLERQRLQNGIIASTAAQTMVEGVRGARTDMVDNPYANAVHHGIEIALGDG